MTIRANASNAARAYYVFFLVLYFYAVARIVEWAILTHSFLNLRFGQTTTRTSIADS